MSPQSHSFSEAPYYMWPFSHRLRLVVETKEKSGWLACNHKHKLTSMVYVTYCIDRISIKHSRYSHCSWAHTSQAHNIIYGTRQSVVIIFNCVLQNEENVRFTRRRGLQNSLTADERSSNMLVECVTVTCSIFLFSRWFLVGYFQANSTDWRIYLILKMEGFWWLIMTKGEGNAIKCDEK